MADRVRVEGGQDDNDIAWNFTANVMDGALFSLALSIISFQTILPLFVRALGGGNMLLGAIPVTWTFGFNAPQILMASRAQRTTERKALLLKTAIGQRIPWILLALTAFFLVERVGPGVSLWVFFCVFALAAIGGSLNLPVWFDLVADLTPVRMRGRLFAARSVLGGVAGIGGGWIAATVLERWGFPKNFGVLFLSAFGVMMCSYLCLVGLREDAPASARCSGQFRPADLRRLLRTSPHLRSFVVADALMVCSTMANGFLAVHILQRFELPETSAGGFIGAMMVGTVVASAFFGTRADRHGHRANLVASGLCTIGAATLALAAQSPEVALPAFTLMSASVTLAGISRLPFIAELCQPVERPAAIASVNLLTSPFTLAGVAGGALADRTGLMPLFLIAAVCAAVAVIWLLTRVHEPRSMFTLNKDNAVCSDR